MTPASSPRIAVGFLIAAGLAGALFASCGKDEAETDPCAPNGRKVGEQCICDTGFVAQGLTCVVFVATVTDAGVTDAGVTDAGVTDAGVTDAGVTDAGSTDAGTDAGVTDAGTEDAGTDAGVTDAGTEDAGTEDAGTEDAGTTDGGTAACFIDPNLGSVTGNNSFAGIDPDGIWYDTELDVAALPDLLLIELWDGYGVFTNGIAPGVYSLTGAETEYATCGACVLILADAPASGAPAATYMATGGTLTLTSVSGTFEGVLANATFTKVTITNAVSTRINDGCATQIASHTFSLPLQQ